MSNYTTYYTRDRSIKENGCSAIIGLILGFAHSLHPTMYQTPNSQVNTMGGFR